MDCLTDNAVRTSKTDAVSRMAVGVNAPDNNPFQTYWTRDYQGIYNTNLFLKDGNGRKVRYMLDRHLDSLLVNMLWGEAYALRAWFEWDLLQKFGGRGTNGEMLGFPILTEPVKDWSKGFTRASYDDCVAQILADCDSAYKYLPLAHRDFLVSSAEDLTVLGSRNWGRIDGISTVAIKALVYQTWASPRFNPQGDISRWQKAAQYAKEVMDFKKNVDAAVAGGFNRRNAVNWFDPNSPEIVFGSRYNSGSETMEKMFYPGGFQGNGTMGATRNRGANLPLLTLYNFWGYDVDLVINDNQELVDRAFISRFQTDLRYSRVYVDFDDTLVLGDKVNTQLIAFLYQARNEGKELYLLTRHACDVREDLRRFGIAESLFDAIYWVRGEDTKIAYIQPDSLFIDDSFAERKRVKEACGIPVFDLDMVESLLNWKS